jgi:hypothetical protein
MIGDYMMVVLVFVLIGFIWHNLCVMNTTSERNALMDYIEKHEDQTELLKLFRKVTFKKHYRAKLLFRNARKLYKPEMTDGFTFLRYGVRH